MNYKEAKKQYNELRNKVYQKVEKELTDRFQKPVQLSHIDINALKAWQKEWCPRLAERKRFTEEELFWNWVNTIREMSNVPSRFELAIWSDNILCGLAIGKPSKGPAHNAIYRLQGSPIKHPLEGKIITIAIKTGTEYARALGKKHLVLVEPLEHLVKIYQRHGFTFKTSKHYPRRYSMKEV
ncbi:hypothetical protein PN36_34835 [Candidatus Thiomargarita nelsonii]|uniref:N-acetyltransferase domain-containing protein n=1 Tax=Candidatus Thiomargarita nelsonii TaxID=1003181 RepID=A0A0A6P1Z1_9GAMM|nr:hypothetical protein PN36_34835 [Candidatus Thiomargarita nelsonii]